MLKEHDGGEGEADGVSGGGAAIVGGEACGELSGELPREAGADTAGKSPCASAPVGRLAVARRAALKG